MSEEKKSNDEPPKHEPDVFNRKRPHELAQERLTQYAKWPAIITAAALAGFLAVYLTTAKKGNDDMLFPGAAPLKKSEAPLKKSEGSPGPSLADNGIRTFNSGKMVAFVYKKVPEAVPALTFKDGTGTDKTLADFKGKAVLLNLWATWCAPCKKEMPGLDRLQKELGSDKFQVVALAVDKGGLEKAQKFLDDVKVSNLKLFIDPTARLANDLRAIGMPTTILIDKDGREVGRLAGEAEWDSEDAKRLIASVTR